MRKDIQKITDAAKAKLKQKSDEIVLLKSELKKANGERVVTFKLPELSIPDKFEIANMPETQKVAGEIKVTNFPDKQSVHIVNLKDIRFPDVQKVEITNQAEDSLKSEHWLPGVMARIGTKQVEYIIKALTNLIEGGISVRLAKNQFTEPVPVVVTDGEGKVLKSLGQIPMVPMGGNGRSSGPYVPTTVNVGRQTVPIPGTPVALSSVSTPCTAVTITAFVGNTGLVAIGGSGVSCSNSLGAVLSPLGSFKIDIDNVSKVYVDAQNANDGVNFTYVR